MATQSLESKKMSAVTMLDDRKEMNPAKFDWLLLRYEPMAGNSPIGIWPWEKVQKTMVRKKFKRVILVRKLRNRAGRKLGLARRVVKQKYKRSSK
jgi:hypothetical protein